MLGHSLSPQKRLRKEVLKSSEGLYLCFRRRPSILTHIKRSTFLIVCFCGRQTTFSLALTLPYDHEQAWTMPHSSRKDLMNKNKSMSQVRAGLWKEDTLHLRQANLDADWLTVERWSWEWYKGWMMELGGEKWAPGWFIMLRFHSAIRMHRVSEVQIYSELEF